VVAPSEFLCKKYNDEEKYNDSYMVYGAVRSVMVTQTGHKSIRR